MSAVLSSFPGPLAAADTCLCPPDTLPSSPESASHAALRASRSSSKALLGSSSSLRGWRVADKLGDSSLEWDALSPHRGPRADMKLRAT